MLLNAHISRIIKLGVNPAFKTSLEFETAHKRAYKRTDEIGTLISEKAKHTLVFASYYTDMSGQPASEIEYTYYVFDDERYIKRPAGEKEGKEFNIRCVVY